MIAGVVAQGRVLLRHAFALQDGDAAILPERVRSIIAAEDRASERLIGYVQLAISAFLWLLYLAAPRPADAALSMLHPVPFALSIFTLFSLVRLWLILKRKTPDWFVAISISADVGLVLGLIWSFHIQYAQPAGLLLKAPTFVYLFILIVLRALRFDPRYVIAAGLASAGGWVLLTLLAIASAGRGAITHSFTDYLTTDRILIGAEAEKVIALIAVTALLAVSARRAQRTLAMSLREQAALVEVRRFLPKGVADQIATSGTLIEAGHAEERDAAILMLDIRGFTALSMRMPPAAVVQILTSFHARVIPIVRANNGVIDKFLGDGVMATFGAAEVSQTAAADALRALEQILQVANDWQDDLPQHGIDVVLKVNASVAAGRVVFATLGFGDRLEYTVIGDAVNLAAKLEKHNKSEKSLAVVPRETVDRAFEQGYRPVINFVLRKQAQISGVDGAMDLNVCVDLPPHAAIAAGY
jgi:adenylate cyclase